MVTALPGRRLGRAERRRYDGRVGGANSAADLVHAILLALHHAVPGELVDANLAVPDGYAPAPVCAGPVETAQETRSRTLLEWLPRGKAPAAVPLADASVQLSVVTPEAGSRVWHNPESPPAADRLVLRAKTTPHVPQVVWYVDGAPFALSDPDTPVTWPLLPGEHRFQIGLPLRPERSRPVRLLVE